MDYPFVKCLNPRSIINPYTDEHLVVPCGQCPACLMRKSFMNAMKCKLESLSHKYSMFVTLTYNNASLPRMIRRCLNRYKDDCGEVCDDYSQDSLIDITTRLSTQGTFLGYTNSSTLTLDNISKKCNLPKNVFPHLSKYDVQLFLKRLRKNFDNYFLNKYGTKAPKIRYYAVGEYGPIHFRPHYHLILWFSNDEVYSIIREVLHKSWSFGRIDCEKSQGKCADYVAKYLNGSSPLPSVFKVFGTRPFCLHSTHLGEEILKVSRSSVYENDFKTAITRSIPQLSVDTDFILWRSLKAFYFPKCKGYSTKSQQERKYTYSTYITAYRWTGKTRVSEQATIITDWILRLFFKMDHIDIDDDMAAPDYRLIQYFMDSVRMDLASLEKPALFKSYIDTMYQSIYSELRLSKHFHTFVCKGFINLYIPMMKKIDEFWSWNDLDNLNEQERTMQEFFLSDWFSNESESQFFYYNKGFDSDAFKDCNFFKQYSMLTHLNFSRAQKHKRLNDANKIFENK